MGYKELRWSIARWLAPLDLIKAPLGHRLLVLNNALMCSGGLLPSATTIAHIGQTLSQNVPIAPTRLRTCSSHSIDPRFLRHPELGPVGARQVHPPGHAPNSSIRSVATTPLNMDSDLRDKWHCIPTWRDSSLILKQIIQVSYDSSKGECEE